MNEPGASSDSGGGANIDSAGLTFGPRLASAREALALSVNDIAARLRISPKQVIAIERENLTALPGPAFVRGFIRNYAKEVKVDPAPLIGALNRVLEPATPSPTPLKGRSPLVHVAEQERSSRVLVIAGAVGALITFAVVGWISNSHLRQEASRVTSVQTAPLAAPAAAAPTIAAPAPDSPSPTQAGTANGVAPTTPSLSALATDAPPSSAAPLSGLASLRLTFRDLCWVEVTQQDGKVLLSQNNEAGTEQTLSGTPPYQLVIGNASAVMLEFGGKPIDLKPVTVGNVARLTLP